MKFTREPEESSFKLTMSIVTFLIFFWGWVQINVPELRGLASIYEFMMVVSLLMASFAYFVPESPFGVYGMPKLEEIVEPTIAGMITGILFTFLGSLTAQIPKQLSPLEPVPLVNPFATFIFYVIAMPWTEEIMFRAVSLPSGANVYGLSTSILLNSLVFPVLHWIVFKEVWSYMIFAFFFSIVLCLLTIKYKSAWVAGVAHSTYNFALIYGVFR